jgi:hypothetical protein
VAIAGRDVRRQGDALTERSNKGLGTAAMLTLILEAPLAIIYGFVFKTLWNWFVPMAFPTAPHLGIGVALGLGLVLGYVLPTIPPEPSKSILDGLVSQVMESLVESGIYLLFGWIIHSIIR